MSTATETINETDILVLEDLNFDHTPKCDNDTCDNNATHLIRCHCGVGTEYSCITCVNQMQDAGKGNPIAGAIQFDGNKSCGHLSLISLCSIVPL